MTERNEGSADYHPGEKLQAIARNVRKPTAALKVIGALMVEESQEGFRNQSFGGVPWPPRGDVNVFGIIADFASGKTAPPQRRFETRPALQDTGRLASSISFRLEEPASVVVGTNVPYAQAHQQGAEVESETITEELQKALGEWLEGPGSKWKKKLGFILSKRLTGEKLKQEVPSRPFIGITRETRERIQEAISMHIFESQR